MGSGFNCNQCCSQEDRKDGELIDGILDTPTNIKKQSENLQVRRSQNGGVFRQSSKQSIAQVRQSTELKQSQNREFFEDQRPNKTGTEIRIVDLQQVDNTMGDVNKIVKIQALIRGFIARRRFLRMKNQNVNIQNGDHFIEKEYKETISKNEVYNPELTPEMKNHQYECTGAIYEGYMRGGFRDGKGKMTWQSGVVYEGDWKEGHATGKGTLKLPDGSYYRGEWLKDRCHGQGIFISASKAKYDGQWNNDLQHGQGVETWPEGSKYIGQYKYGKKSGVGTYIWKEGAEYNGEWFDNMLEGMGRYHFADGRTYYGQWHNNEMHGVGIYDHGNGVKYEGQYVNDRKQGYGVFYAKDQKKYEGWFYDGKMHGLVIQKDPTKGKQKQGLWEHGNRLIWFSPQQIDQIQKGTYDFEQNFKNPKSVMLIDKDIGFNRPPNFNEVIASIKHKLAMK